MKFLLVAIVALAPFSLAPSRAASPIAVVVGPQSSLHNLSMSDLRRVYLGYAGRVDRVEGIQVVEFTPLRREFYERVLEMSESRVKRHWIGLLFAGEATVPPKEFDQIPEVRDYLAGNAKAIAFVPLNQAGPPLKVISVDGFSPSSTEYPLR